MKLNINEVHFVVEMINSATVKVSEARDVLNIVDKFDAEFVRLQKQDVK
tara:strand:- start:1580 stop:1726 length:147 start_codon:yes stop_codon:yes gene_type:complete